MKKHLIITSVGAALSLLALRNDAGAGQIVLSQPQDNTNDQGLFLAPAQYDTNLLVAGHRSHSSHRSHRSHSSHRSGSSGYIYSSPSSSTPSHSSPSPSYSTPSKSASSPSSSTARPSVVTQPPETTKPSAGSIETFDSTLVSMIQARLKRLGYPISMIDGKLGLETQRSIKLFQLEHGLTPDGIPSNSLFILMK